MMKTTKVKINKKDYLLLKNKLLSSKTVALFTHISPDADALGSISALSEMLIKNKKEVVIFLENPYQETFNFLPLKNIQFNNKKSKTFDIVVAVDVANPSLLGKFQDVYMSNSNKLVIDHHSKRIKFADVEIVEENVSSTCELLYYFFKKLNVGITKTIANSLLTGIIGDTGRFLHASTTTSTLKVVIQLMDSGADLNLINSKLYKNLTLENLKAQKLVIENLELNGVIGVSFLKIQDIKINKISHIQSAELINLIASLSSVEIAILLIEQADGTINVSFRSTTRYDVSKVADKFGGGGHKHASGIKKFKGNLDNLKKDLINYILDNLGELKINDYINNR